MRRQNTMPLMPRRKTVTATTSFTVVTRDAEQVSENARYLRFPFYAQDQQGSRTFARFKVILKQKAKGQNVYPNGNYAGPPLGTIDAIDEHEIVVKVDRDNPEARRMVQMVAIGRRVSLRIVYNRGLSTVALISTPPHLGYRP